MDSSSGTKPIYKILQEVPSLPNGPNFSYMVVINYASLFSGLIGNPLSTPRPDLSTRLDPHAILADYPYTINPLTGSHLYIEIEG